MKSSVKVIILLCALYLVTVGMVLTFHPWDSTNTISYQTPGETSRAIPSITIVPEQPSALCNDGTYSYSQHRRGTCSWHGGVSKWLKPLPP
jgi:hypothetical protein